METKINIFLILLFFAFTACHQKQNKTESLEMKKFEAFKAKEKFIEDADNMYPGIGDKKLKPILTQKINLAATDFEVLAEKGNASVKDYQNAIKKGLSRFKTIYQSIDTEDRERICTYFEELMDIVGLESSGGHLNHFIYGFNPN